jgi:hypothetical protein
MERYSARRSFAGTTEGFMIEPSRHVPLRSEPWDQGAAFQAIDEIVADALDQFGDDQFWPAHPLDMKGSYSSIYVGAPGIIWALEHLRRVGATTVNFDFRPYLPRLLERTKREMATYEDYANNGSLLLGDMGTALLIMRLEPSSALADLIQMRAVANTRLPIRELMWGMPGSMIACLSMSEITGEARWQAIYATQAERLLADLQETPDGPIWEQDLHGRHLKYLGPVHGNAGNMVPLLRGWELADGTSARSHRGRGPAHAE